MGTPHPVPYRDLLSRREFLERQISPLVEKQDESSTFKSLKQRAAEAQKDSK